jgi:hypothetical protein
MKRFMLCFAMTLSFGATANQGLDPACKKLSEALEMGWKINSIPGTTRFVAKCVSRDYPNVTACVATAKPKYPDISTGGDYVAFQINTPRDFEAFYSHSSLFFTDRAKTKVQRDAITAQDKSVKGISGNPGRFGGRGGFKVDFKLNLRTGHLQYKYWRSEDTIRLPIMIDWELMQDSHFSCVSL